MQKSFAILLAAFFIMTSGLLLFCNQNKEQCQKYFIPDFAASLNPEEKVSTLGDINRLSQETTTNEKIYEWVANTDGQTAFELLKDNAEIEYQQYDFGVMVEGINGLKSDDQNYWALYINNNYSQVGADQVKLKAGDKVMWRYEVTDQSKFDNT